MIIMGSMGGVSRLGGEEETRAKLGTVILLDNFLSNRNVGYPRPCKME